MDGTPEAVLRDPELMDLLPLLLRADVALVGTYRSVPRRTVNCAVVAFGGRNDSWVAHERLGHWAEPTSGPRATVTFPGGRCDLQDAREALPDLIAARLREAMG